MLVQDAYVLDTSPATRIYTKEPRPPNWKRSVKFGLLTSWMVMG